MGDLTPHPRVTPQWVRCALLAPDCALTRCTLLVMRPCASYTYWPEPSGKGAGV